MLYYLMCASENVWLLCVSRWFIEVSSVLNKKNHLEADIKAGSLW